MLLDSVILNIYKYLWEGMTSESHLRYFSLLWYRTFPYEHENLFSFHRTCENLNSFSLLKTRHKHNWIALDTAQFLHGYVYFDGIKKKNVWKVFTLIGFPSCVWCVLHVSIIFRAIHAICWACIELYLCRPDATQ